MSHQFGSITRAKSLLLPLYFHGTRPLRRSWIGLASLFKRCPIAILFYHRIADRSPNSWTISRQLFREQMDWLAEHVELISLAEVQRRLQNRNSTRLAAAITFDDGYAENSDFALPMLIERRVPVMYFVASEFVLRNRPFPHDVERGEPLAPNTLAQLRFAADQGIEIGAHTRTHADLGSLRSYDALRSEIAGSRLDLEQSLGRPVNYFAFPYGQRSNIQSTAIQIARQAGFRGICSAFGGYNFAGRSAFHLRRLHADPNMCRFKNWASFDPRIALKRGEL